MKITRIRIRDYRGIEHLDVDIAPAGAVISGQNGKGKTSVLKAISSALAANGIGPDAVRIGADKAEILIHLDDLAVRRVISARNSTVTIKDKEGKGEQLTRPQQRLTEMLGTSALDPLGFFLADSKERKRIVLEAVPLRVTTDDILGWIGKDIPTPITIKEGHGLDVIEALRADFYQQRTAANREAEAAEAAAEKARPGKLPPAKAPDLAQAAAAVEAARKACHELDGRKAAAASASGQTAETRRRIAELREQAAREIPVAGTSIEGIQHAEAELAGVNDRVSSLRQQLAEAEAHQQNLGQRLARLRAERAEYERFARDREADALRATELEQSLASVDALGVTDAEVEAAHAALAAAQAEQTAATEAWDLRIAHDGHGVLVREAREAEKRAARLDEIVRTLTTKAPTDLARRSEMIPGLSFSGDGILLDGVAVDSLSGAEQMKFAVDLARRLNAKAKILVVDGLERLDAKNGIAFVEMATADGWQLFGTRVADGDLVIEAIEV